MFVQPSRIITSRVRNQLNANVTMSRSRTSSVSSTPSKVSFGSIRLNDLVEKYDEYGFNLEDQIDEEAVEATMPDEHVIPAGGEESDSGSASPEKASLGSNDSKQEQSVIGALIDKAKSRGRKLVAKNKSKSPELVDEAQQTLLLDPQDGGETLSLSEISTSSAEISKLKTPCEALLTPQFGYSLAQRYRSMPFFHHRMVILGMLIAITFAFPGFITGTLWGFYISFIGFLYLFVSEPKSKEVLTSTEDSYSISDDEIEMANEANSSFDGKALGIGDGITYKGWMNELKTRYSPAGYHVNHAQSVLVRLEGTTLRISRPAKTVLKHAFHEDPTLKQAQPTMVSQTIYDLNDAQVSLRPKRLAPRRWWSRKYPIYIRFAKKTSALAEIDLTKSMPRSVSLHPVGSAPDGLPIFSEIPKVPMEDPGYSAESETSDEDTASVQVQRSNSTGDLSEFQLKSDGGKSRGRSIYLFARAAREKERWFHLLREACSKPRTSPKGRVKSMKRSTSYEPNTVTASVEKELQEPRRNSRPVEAAAEYLFYQKNHLQFAKQMYDIMARALSTPERGSIVSVDLGTMKWHPGTPEENSDLVESINALATRIFFDFCRDQFWINAVKQKIQSKLATIHLPYFIETLELSELDLGITAPLITGVYSPKMDEWGLWVDTMVHYEGGIRLVIQTSVNLLKLKSGSQTVEAEKEVTRLTSSVRATRYSDDDIPESPESSPDEDFGSKNETEQIKERKSKRIINLVEKAAQSSIFQKVSKVASVAKLMEEFSSTPLILNVEIAMFEGTMTFNIPPPPSDRLWYAFRRVPKMIVKAVPQVGDRSVDMTTVSEWIESKLKLLIEKNLVCPNMDDIVLPVMSGNSLLHMGYNQ